jgi:hypothetical protein
MILLARQQGLLSERLLPAIRARAGGSSVAPHGGNEFSDARCKRLAPDIAEGLRHLVIEATPITFRGTPFSLLDFLNVG